MPLKPAKLERMSLRTTPVVDSTFGPFEPSPGYGPSVSSGIVLHELADVVPPLLPVVVVDVVDDVVDEGDVVLPLQPKSVSAPAPKPSDAASRNRPRRSIAAPVARRSRCKPP
ncbi:MAG: hypothetical protein QM736_09625 [Vicinamibacterales bacterium]